MELKETIERRRAQRALDLVDIDDGTVRELTGAASLAPSCYNNQPWRFVLVREKEQLDRLKATLTKGNAWALRASMIIAVHSEPSLDCDAQGSKYYLFDTGMAVAFVLLRATDLGLLAHPISGFDHSQAKAVLGIPEANELFALIIVGKHSDDWSGLKDWQLEREKDRPKRLPFERIASMESFV